VVPVGPCGPVKPPDLITKIISLFGTNPLVPVPKESTYSTGISM
jgi:hypothetical protein